MRQAQDMQERMQKMQAEVANMQVSGEAGAGMVRVTLNGKYAASKVEIDAAAMSEDHEFLEDLVAAAINDAVHKVQAAVEEKTAGMTAGLNLPAGFKLPI